MPHIDWQATHLVRVGLPSCPTLRAGDDSRIIIKASESLHTIALLHGLVDRRDGLSW